LIISVNLIPEQQISIAVCTKLILNRISGPEIEYQIKL